MYGKRALLLTLAFLIAAAFLPAPLELARNGSAQSVNRRQPGRIDKKIESSSGISFRSVKWTTVVNNSYYIPKSKKFYNSYNQPSVNRNGTVVFRARGKGQPRATGIYKRNPGGGSLWSFADLVTEVPYPNNLGTAFNEFPSIPRISPNTGIVATRGNHQPVFVYELPDGSETRAGTTGIYAVLDGWNAMTAMSKLGGAPDLEFFAVPGSDPPIPFDVFPGSPAVTDDGTVVFKGNYTDNGVSKTGAFFRKLLNTPGGGSQGAETLATSDTEIPGAPPSADFKKMTFGSVAPPSAQDDHAVFVALDNEDDPHYGGIYYAPLKDRPPIEPLVEIGKPVPGLTLPALTAIGEALSFDGRYVAFWAAWGRDTKTVRLYCPEEGNQDRRNYCNGGDPNSRFDKEAERWYQEKEVPINQGLFMYDLYSRSAMLVTTSADFDDFLFWGYTGMVPGVGHEADDSDGEEPRWRSSAYLSVSDGLVAFKARTGYQDKKNVYVNPIDGIYLTDPSIGIEVSAVIETGMDGGILDPDMPFNLREVFPVTEVGIEREGLRGRYLSISAKMGTEEDGWGGIYVGVLH